MDFLPIPRCATRGMGARGFGPIVGVGSGPGKIRDNPIGVAVCGAVPVGVVSKAFAMSPRGLFNPVAKTATFSGEDCEKTLALLVMGTCPETATNVSALKIVISTNHCFGLDRWIHDFVSFFSPLSC